MISPRTPLKTMSLFNDFFPSSVLTILSDRRIDFSLPKGKFYLDAQQKKYLASADVAEMMNIRQVHGNHILVIDENYQSLTRSLPEADGLVTNLPGKALMVRTADCLPVFIYDPFNEVIGMVHAGWQSTQKKIVENTIQIMRKYFQSQPADIKAAFGPGIRSCCCQVTEEFSEYFPKEIERRDGHLYFDLPRANQNQLLEAGLSRENILDDLGCTCCNKKYFSYRREGEQAGRMLSLMMLKSET